MNKFSLWQLIKEGVRLRLVWLWFGYSLVMVWLQFGLVWFGLVWLGHTVVLWLICQHRDIGNSTYMKVIVTKNLTFINIIYHAKFQFAKMSGSLENWHFLTPFLVHKSHRNSKNYILFIVLDIFSNWNCVWW